MVGIANDPLISVVICTRNRADLLYRALASVARQDFRTGQHEVLVVDNGSTDRTREVVAAAAACGPVRYLHESEPGLCVARNLGWRGARGRYIAYLDDDAVARPGWLAAIPAGFRCWHRPPGVVGGRVVPDWEARRPDWLSDEIALSLTIVDWGAETRELVDLGAEWLVGANMAVPRELLASVGGFHPWLDRVGSNLLSGGDVHLQKEIARRGHPCLYHPPMAVEHLVPAARLTREWFERRYFWQGLSDAVMHLVERSPSRVQRLRLAGARLAGLASARTKLASLVMPAKQRAQLTTRCFALIELGFVMGMLGYARR